MTLTEQAQLVVACLLDEKLDKEAAIAKIVQQGDRQLCAWCLKELGIGVEEVVSAGGSKGHGICRRHFTQVMGQDPGNEGAVDIGQLLGVV